MSTPTPDGSDGWLFVAIALAVPAALELLKRIFDAILPPGRHFRGVERFTRRNDDESVDDAEGD